MIVGVAQHLKVAILIAGCTCSLDKATDDAASQTVTTQHVVQKQAAAPVPASVLAPAPAPAAKSDADTLSVDAAACRYLVKHQANADVSYQSGVDVSGRSVAPADLSGGVPLVQLPDTQTIDITPDLTKYLPNTNPPYDRLTNSKINVGTVTLSGDMVTLNGQPLSSEVQENLAVLCLQKNK
jgi:hypothetical protein